MKLINTSYYHNKVLVPVAITAETEREMFLSFRRRRTPAKLNRIVRQYICWAAKIAHHYAGPRNPIDDVISSANAGLIEAIYEFDASLGFRFVTYSFFAIRRKIFFDMSRNFVVNPTNETKRIKQAEKPSPKRARKIGAVYQSVGNISSIDREGDLPDSDRFSGEIDPAYPQADDTRTRLECGEILGLLRRRIHRLKRPDRIVMEQRYFSTPPASFMKIAALLGCKRAHARYLHDRAIRMLRAELKAEL